MSDSTRADERRAALAEGRPVSVLAGDRLCASCGCNLTGCTIVREPRYELLVVACPRCEAVTAMDEYPPLGRWMQRWAMLAAAIWLLLLGALAAVPVGIVVGVSIGTAAECTDRWERELRNDSSTWLLAHSTDVRNPPPFSAFVASGALGQIDLRSRIEWDELALLLIPLSAAIVAGLLWSVLLLHWRRRWMLLVAALLGTGLVVLALLALLILRAIEPINSEHVVWMELRLPMLMIFFAAETLVFLGALALGRPLARGFVRVLLPPRHQGAMAILWTADGKRPPQQRRAASRSAGS